jgi:hypothetical protein
MSDEIKGSASEAKLGTLHGVVADVLTTALTTALPEGAVLSPALLGAAITFLKNNNITASPSENAALVGLNTALNARRRKGQMTLKSANEAADAFADLNSAHGMLPQ